MKQVFQNPKSGDTNIEEVTSPKLKKGGVLVKNSYSLISPGTERGIIKLSKKNLLQKAKERPDYVKKFLMLAKTKGIQAAWKVAQSKLDTDIALGYSSAGSVIKVSDDVEEFQAGERVACAGQNYASHAETIFVPKNLCVKIPNGVTDEHASFVTLGAIALRGIHQAKLEPGERVAVIGLGLLGQLAVRMLKAYGHPVIGFDIDKSKINYAKKNSGLDVGIQVAKNKKYSSIVSRFTEGGGVDAALIYASAPDASPLEIATEILRDRGRVVQVGKITPNIPWRDFYLKELEFYSSRSYGPGRYDPNYEEGGNDYPIGHVRWTEKRNMEEFLRLLNEGFVGVGDLISGVFDIDEAHKAYEQVFNPKGNLFGLLLKYPQNKKEESDVLKLSNASKKMPAEDEINIGLIGVGSFVRSTILPHLEKVKDAKVNILAIADSTGKKAKKEAEKWKAEYVTNDYKKIIKDKRINLVVCATRHSSHADIAVEVLKANKNLYMEKPLALNGEELERVMKAAKKSKGRLFVGFNRRFSQHFKRAHEVFGKFEGPTMMMYRINYPFDQKDHWSYDINEGGRIIGEDCHFVDAARFIANSPIVKVHASVISPGDGVEREENVVITMEHKNRSISNIFYSALGSFKLPKEYIEIYGGGNIMTIDNFKSGKLMSDTKIEKINLWHQDKGYDEELKAFIRSIREGKPSPFSLEELWNSHQAIFEAYKSFKDGEVKIVEN